MKKSLLVIVLVLLALAALSAAKFNTASLFKLDSALRPIVQPYEDNVGLRFIDLESNRELLINAQLIVLLEQNMTREVAGVINAVGTVESPAGNYVLSVFTSGISDEADARNLIDQLSKAVYEVYTYEPKMISTEANTGSQTR